MVPISSSTIQREYRLFHDIYLFLSADDRLLLQQFGLTSTQYSALMLLDDEAGLQLVTLADRIIVARSTVTRLIDQLEASGIVRRIVDPADRRAQRVVLTAQGHDLRQRVHEAHHAALAARLSALTSAEHDQLLLLLQKVRDGLEPEVGEEAPVLNLSAAQEF